MNRSARWKLTLFACGIAAVAGLAAQPRAAIPSALAQPATVEVTIVDTDFDSAPFSSLPAPLVLGTELQPCTSASVVEVSNEASNSGSRSLKVQGCSQSSPSVAEAAGWTLPLPQYAPIVGANLTVHRMMSSGLGTRSWLGLAPSGQVALHEWLLLMWENGTIFGPDQYGGENYGHGTFHPGQFDKVELDCDFATSACTVRVNDGVVTTDMAIVGDNVDVLTSYTYTEATYYDDDLRLTVEYETSPTVVIDGCDTGVPDVDLGGGQTIFGLVMQCAASATTHGAFESCVADLRNELQRSQVISANQKGAIQSCAAGADIPN